MMPKLTPAPDAERIAFSPREAARVAGLGAAVIYRALKERELRSHLVGKRSLILRTDLVAWIDAAPPPQPSRPPKAKPETNEASQ
jgi:excisionase family DNA binding protein